MCESIAKRTKQIVILPNIMPKGHPLGSKTAVLAKRKSKKRSCFSGKPAWQKKAEGNVPKSVLTITYVGDCDVGSSDEASNNLQVSVSKRKLDATV